MKTTLQLPDPILRAVKSRAAEEGKPMAKLIAEFLTAGLSRRAKPAARRTRLEFPLIHQGRPHSLDLNTERLAELELQEEAAHHAPSLRR